MAEFKHLSQSEEDFDRQLRAAYVRAQERLQAIMLRSLTRSEGARPAARQRALLAQVDQVLAELGEERQLILAQLMDVYQDASERAVQAIVEETGIDRDELDVSFGLVDQRAVERAIQLGASALDDAALQFRSKARRLVQSTQLFDIDSDIRRTVASGIARGESRRDVSKRLRALIGGLGDFNTGDILDQIEDVAGDQIIQVGGWRGTLENYAETVARTMMRDASTQATVNRAVANDVQHLEVSRTLSSVDSCVVFEGLIVTATGEDDRFPHVNQLPNSGTPFHPRCTHVLAPRSLETMTAKEIASKGRIKRRYLGKTWRQLERIRRSNFGGDFARMRADARN